jgi:hypothetical protein
VGPVVAFGLMVDRRTLHPLLPPGFEASRWAGFAVFGGGGGGTLTGAASAANGDNGYRLMG